MEATEVDGRRAVPHECMNTCIFVFRISYLVFRISISVPSSTLTSTIDKTNYETKVFRYASSNTDTGSRNTCTHDDYLAPLVYDKWGNGIERSSRQGVHTSRVITRSQHADHGMLEIWTCS